MVVIHVILWLESNFPNRRGIACIMPVLLFLFLFLFWQHHSHIASLVHSSHGFSGLRQCWMCALWLKCMVLL